MSVCTVCHQEMTSQVACTEPVYTIRGRSIQRLPYPDGDLSWPENCGDCGTPLGGLHHPGCDMERCPNDQCAARGRFAADRAQAITCGCVPFDDLYEDA